MAEQYLELIDLQERIKEGLQSLFPGKAWVKAEISQWSPRSNGHCYLSLSQSRDGRLIAEARAMIWKWHYPALKAFFEQAVGETLRAGLSVLVRVQVNYSELYGVSLFIDAIDPSFTIGEKELERKRNLERLRQGGYLEMQQEFALPRLPYRLAVISSETAAGYGDFCRHLLDNPYAYRFAIQLFPALMQGDGAPASMQEALRQVCAQGPWDAVLLLRGGGSDFDLACYDDYDLAVAIATAPYPILTAIGHERDRHLADLVAHRSLKTPTALADFFLDIYLAEDAAITALSARISAALQSRWQQPQTALTACLSRIRYAASARQAEAWSRVALLEARIRSGDPHTILERGYVLVTGADSKILKSVDRVQSGDRIGVRFADGSLAARVEEVLPDTVRNTIINTA